MYPLVAYNVKLILDAIINEKVYDKKAFEYYHLNRNHFNVKSEITQLEEINTNQFRDNFGNIWTEVSTLKNYYHMPTGNWLSSMVGYSVPYSRKFLRDDTVSGLNGEFEMIIRTDDGKRIDGLEHVGFQETYNFGRTRDFSVHKILDVDPHRANPNYEIKQNMGYVKIIGK